MVVRDEHGVDVRRRVAQPRQRRRELTPIAGQPGVEHGQPAAFFEDVPVCVTGGQSVDAISDLGDTERQERPAFTRRL